VSRRNSQFVCQSCGAVYPKWSGRCDACGAWNSISEEALPDAAPRETKGKAGRRIEVMGLTGETRPPPRMNTGIAELDRVCGGGLVAGSALLVGGDPGIGKSTLLLQAMAQLSSAVPCLYISGEEAIEQVRLRAERLGVSGAPLGLASATSVRDIAASLDHAGGPRAVVIDSIQTLFVDTLESAPGTVGQVRASAQELIRLAKRRGFALILVGHVTKEGAIAGPKVLEHMVDTVLSFEGESGYQFRILRANKNRFGPTDEIGVFEMTVAGLVEVANPSALFLGDRTHRASGTCVFAGLEGTRPVLVEIQALVAPSQLGSPRRAVVGWDSSRLAMILAVLDARCGFQLGGLDVYLNVAGGLRISDPAADLAVAAALVSAATDATVPNDAVTFGEISLSGQIRPVSQTENRLKEAEKLGFDHAIVAAQRTAKPAIAASDSRRTGARHITELGHLADLVALFPDDSNAPRRTAGTPGERPRPRGAEGGRTGQPEHHRHG
jgi:DNA repair protein RadA/Sms